MKKTYQQLKNSLKEGDILYTTRNNVHYRFKGWANEALKFSIPSRNNTKPDNYKYIDMDVLMGKTKPTFKDCRLSVYKNL